MLEEYGFPFASAREGGKKHLPLTDFSIFLLLRDFRHDYCTSGD